jgi:DNA-binding transcriptional MerR regulator
VTPKLYKAGDVCEIAQVQPYVLRSWEKEFPGIGVQKSADSPRLYRQSDLDQVLRIKQLVFGEGLTLAGARRRLEERASAAPDAEREEAEAIETLDADARAKIARVRQGLRTLLEALSGAPGAVAATAAIGGLQVDAGLESYELRPPTVTPSAGKPRGVKPRAIAARVKPSQRSDAPDRRSGARRAQGSAGARAQASGLRKA